MHDNQNHTKKKKKKKKKNNNNNNNQNKQFCPRLFGLISKPSPITQLRLDKC